MDLRTLMPFGGRGVPARAGDDPFSALHREMNRLFDDVYRGVPMPRVSSGEFQLAPSMDVTETKDAYGVAVELPGVDEKDVEVKLADGMLTIKGEKKYEKTEDEEGRHLVERSYGSFMRSLSVPSDVDASRISAEFSKGVLKVALPKLPEAEAKAHTIKVKTT